MLLFCSCSCFLYRRAKSHFYRLGGQAYIKLAIKNSKMKMDQFSSGWNEERGEKSLTLKEKTGRFQRYLARIFWILTQGSRVDINESQVKSLYKFRWWWPSTQKKKKVMVFFKKVYRYGYKQQWQSRKMPDDRGPFLFSLPHTSEDGKMEEISDRNIKCKTQKFMKIHKQIPQNQL